MDWAQILVIILAILFAVFLLLAITLAVLIISVTRQIKAAAASAERTVSALEGTVSQFNKAAIPMMITRKVIAQIMKSAKKKERSKNHE
jgi:uncharacterized protein involved in cysteine biosynthesis